MVRKNMTNIGSGLFLIIIGLIFLLDNFNIINIRFSILAWPIALLLPAIGFHLAFFLSGRRKDLAGLLVPGGILLVLSLNFYFEMFTDFHYSHLTWPIYILAPAVGLFELYWFGERDRALLIPVGILSAVALFFFAQMIFAALFQFWPIIFILFGIYLLFGRRKNKQDHST